MASAVTGLVGLVAIGLGVAQIRLGRNKPNLIPFTIAAAIVTFVVGFLGTVLGLISAYAQVALADPSQKANLLSQGISESMYSLALGAGLLIIIVPLIAIGIVRRRPPTEQ